jgi:hypothetical protein
VRARLASLGRVGWGRVWRGEVMGAGALRARE